MSLDVPTADPAVLRSARGCRSVRLPRHARRRRDVPVAAVACGEGLRPRLRRRSGSTRSIPRAAVRTAGRGCSRPRARAASASSSTSSRTTPASRRRPRTRPGGTCCSTAASRAMPTGSTSTGRAGRVLLPVLGDDFDAEPARASTAASCAISSTASRSRPAPATAPPAEVAERQHYELVNFRRADTEQNYRRFFAVVTLAGLRIEDPAVLDATHEQIRRWVRDDGIDGLRVDHPDGLADPVGYMTALRELAGAGRVADGREDPRAGRGAAARLAGRRHDRLRRADRGAGPVRRPACRSRLRRALPRSDRRPALVPRSRRGGQAHRGRRRSCRPRCRGWRASCPDVEDAGEALAELAVHFPVYRLVPADRCRASRPGDQRPAPPVPNSATPSERSPRGCPTRPTSCACGSSRLTGAVMAKGVEDTTYYRTPASSPSTRSAATPPRSAPPRAFHDAQGRRQETLPHSMTTLSTHDTKRGEDVRARLAVLSELPDEWAALARTADGVGAAPRRRRSATCCGRPSSAPGSSSAIACTPTPRRRCARRRRAPAGSTPTRRSRTAVHGAVDRAYDDAAVRRPLRRVHRADHAVRRGRTRWRRSSCS